MDRKVEHDSSSSEDETCMEAIREAADQDFLRNLLSKADGNLLSDISFMSHML